MGEPGTPTDAVRRARRAFASEIVASVRNDEEMPLEYATARDAGVEMSFETLGVSVCSRARVEELAFVLAQEIEMLQQDQHERLHKLDEASGMETATWTSGIPTIAAIMADSNPGPRDAGDVVFVHLPPNCSIHGMPGYGPDDLARIVTTAIKVGEHWDNQDGINAAYLDELAAATKPRRI